MFQQKDRAFLKRFVGIALITFYISICLRIIRTLSSVAHAASSSLMLAATPTPVPSGPPATGGGLDSTIIAALIGLVIGVPSLAIAFWTVRRSERLQRELATKNEHLQRELATQNEQAQREAAHQNEQLQRELVRTQKELERQYAEQAEQDHREQEINAAEKKRQQMLRASTNEQRAQLYREALQKDPLLSTIKIFDMPRPLETLHVYVRLRLHQETQLGYRPDLMHEQAEPLRDPNAAFQSDWKRREQRLSSALDPEEAVRLYPRCVLLGDPGAGKTTLLRYLALMTANKALPTLADVVPIYVELNAFVRSGLSDLLDYAAQTWDGAYAFPHQEARRYMADQLYDGTALLLLDALDETVVGETVEQAEHSYASVSQAILHVAARYPQASVVVTARKAGYQQRAPLSGFTELEVLDFRPEDIEQFITNWYKDARDLQKHQKSRDLILRLERNPRLQALAANPLLLSLIVLVYEAQLELPDRRADLYKRCVDALLTEWDARRNIRRLKQFHPEHKRQLLKAIAWHFHQQGRRYFPERELLQVIADFLPAVGIAKDENRSILLEIASEHGLLKEQAQGWYGFVHMTLQEYFVALEAADQDHLDHLLIHRANAWWEEVFLLYAGSVPDASIFFRRLLGHDQDHSLTEDIFSTNLLLAGSCLGSRPTIRTVSLRESITTRLFATLCATSYTLLQEHSAERLAAMGDEQTSRQLSACLSDASLPEDLRGRIADALGHLGERTVAPGLMALLSDASLPEDLRGCIADALGHLGERSVALTLVGLLSDASLPEDLRENIAVALGNLGERSVALTLVERLSDASLPEVLRVYIAWALGDLGERTVALTLVGLLSDASLPEDLRENIAWVLGNLGERAVALTLVERLSDASLPEDLRGHIAVALGHLGERAVALTLVERLSDASLSEGLRVYIAVALGSLGERAVAPGLVALLSDASLPEYLRRYIAGALGHLGERAVAPGLMALLSDASLPEGLRGYIAGALGNLGERAVAPSLVSLLSDASLPEDLRWRIALALGRLGERAVAPSLVSLLSDASLPEGLRWRIADALGSLGERAVAPSLVGLLSDASLPEDLRGRIADALKLLAYDPTSMSQLAHLLAHPTLADTAYTILWTVSRQAGVSIFPSGDPADQSVKIVPWEDIR